jgi:hypothetical protein
MRVYSARKVERTCSIDYVKCSTINIFAVSFLLKVTAEWGRKCKKKPGSPVADSS